MEKKEIEELVKSKITEAKLEIAEKRLNYFMIIAGSMLTLFGIFMPLFFTMGSSTETKNEMKELKRDFLTENDKFEQRVNEQYKNLSESQNKIFVSVNDKIDKTLKETKEESKRIIDERSRSPRINCLYNGKDINGATIKYKFIEGEGLTIPFELYNTGNAVAKNVRVFLYIKDGSDVRPQSEWKDRSVSEVEDYKASFESGWELTLIEAKTKIAFPLSFYKEKSSSKTSTLIFKIFCGLLEPFEIKFNLEEE